MDMKLLDALNLAFEHALNEAGENPNMLGFMRRVPGPYVRRGPNGQLDMPTEKELKHALAQCSLAVHLGRW